MQKTNTIFQTLTPGASSGIGAGAAILFCKLGAEVAITGRDVDNLSKTAEECQKSNGKKVNVVLAILADKFSGF